MPPFLWGFFTEAPWRCRSLFQKSLYFCRALLRRLPGHMGLFSKRALIFVGLFWEGRGRLTRTQPRALYMWTSYVFFSSFVFSYENWLFVCMWARAIGWRVRLLTHVCVRFVCLFVCCYKTRKSILRSLCLKGSNNPWEWLHTDTGTDHMRETKTAAQTTYLSIYG